MKEKEKKRKRRRRRKRKRLKRRKKKEEEKRRRKKKNPSDVSVNDFTLRNLLCLPQIPLNTLVEIIIPVDGHLIPSHFPGPLTVAHSEHTFLSPFWLQDQQT